MNKPFRPFRRWRHLKRGTTYMEMHRDVIMGVDMTPEGTKLSLVALSPGKIVASLVGIHSGNIIASNVTLQTECPPFGSNLVIYMAEKDGVLHARSQKDFLDGRFEEIPRS